MKYFFLFLPIFITAQFTNVKGFVKSDYGNLGYASVSLLKSEKGVITNDNGYFEIDIDFSKENELFISYLGHISKKISLNNKALNFNNLIIYLEEDINGLNEIVVTGTMKDEFVTESPVKVNVITAKKINSFLPSAGTNITKIIQLINGAQEVIACGVCYTNSISINGLEGPYTSILMDGIPMYGNLASVYGLNGIPNMIIDRLEIVKGPSSTLYGSEAVAGVINIITKNPEDQPFLSLDIQGTSHMESYINMTLTPKIGNTTGYFGLNWDRKNDYDDYNSDGFGDDINLDRISIFNKWNIHRKSKKQFIISSRYYFEDRRNGVEEFLKNGNYKKLRGSENIYGESIYTSRVELFGTYKFNNEISFQFSFNDHNQNSVYGTTLFKADQSIAFGQFIWNRTIKKHDLVIGAAYRFTFYDDNTTATFNEFLGINKEEITQLPGVFIQDEIQFNEQNSLLLGFRYDYNSIHGTIFTPRLNYKISNQDLSSILRISIGSGYRIAQIFTEDHAALTGARDVVFLNDLDPETSWNINLNYVYKMYLKQGHILNFDASIFRTDFSNKILPNYDTDPNLIIFDNLSGKSVTQGISLNFNSVFQNGLRISLGATYIDSYIDSKGLKTIPYLTEKFQGVWNIKYEFQKSNITLDFTGTITGPLKLPLLGDLDPRSQFSPTFNIINLQLTKEWNNSYELYGGVKNILNFTPADNSIARAFDPFDREVKFDTSGAAQVSPGNPYALTFDPSYVYASNQGSRFFIGFRYYLN